MSQNQITSTNEQRDVSIDLVRVVAAFLVICIHCNFDYFHQINENVYQAIWLFPSGVASFSRICVPLFFMISGFLLIRPGVDAFVFYRKRIGRVLIPLLAWSVIYILVRVFMEGNQISFLSACRIFYNNEVYYHLWFLYDIVAVYLFIPILCLLPEKLLIFFTALTFILCSLIPFGDRLLTAVSGQPFHLGIPTGNVWIFTGYAALGALARNWRASPAVIKVCAAALSLSFILTLTLTVMTARQSGQPSEKWFGYGESAVAIAACSSFVLLRSVKCPPRAAWSLRALGSLSFGIYLCHPLVIAVLRSLKWAPPEGVLLGLPTNIAVVSVLSAGLVATILRIPLVRQIV